MRAKFALRKKAIILRKKKYFEINSSFFNPILSILKSIKKNNILNLALYYPSNCEVNVLKFVDFNKNKKIKTFLPIIKSKDLMEFVEWKSLDPLNTNIYGLLEPVIKKNSLIPDIILVPLLAFDKNKNRLGYGKGFYDRFLTKFLNKRKIITIGVAFSFQKYNKVPTSSGDVRLDYILTDKGLIKWEY